MPLTVGTRLGSYEITALLGVGGMGAGATYLNKERRIEDLRRAAARAQARVPGIWRIRVFGSLAAGTPTPRSDADLLIVVDTSPHQACRDRIPDMLAACRPCHVRSICSC